MTYKKSITLSASQIDTFQTCPRKWWLDKVAKCPQPSDRKLLLGEVGHSVGENHLLSKPLYPEGWTSPTNRFTGQKSEHHITSTEQALVKALITKAIDEGVLIRHPDQVIEKEFRLRKVAQVEDVSVSIIGFIDHFYGNHIDDHKFTGAPRYYGASKLSSAIAMNLYAYAMYEEGLIAEPSAWLRYNLFVKDLRDPVVKKVEVEKSKEDIYKYYEEEIVPSFKPMALAQKNCTSWEQVDSAMARGEAKKACEKYGGCPYLDICMGKVGVDDYKARFASSSVEEKKKTQSGIIESLLNNKAPKGDTKSNNPSGDNQGDKKMSGFLSNMKKIEAGKPAPTQVEEPKAQESAAPETTTTPVEKARAPWAFNGCPACKMSKSTTLGINDKHEPCNICEISTNQMRESDPDQPIVADYDIAVSDKGEVSWSIKGSEEKVAESKPVEKEPVVKEAVQSIAGADDFEPDPEGLEAAKKEEQVVESNPIPPVTKEKLELSDVLNSAEFSQERNGFLVSYAPVRSKKRASKKLGEGNCVVMIAELMEFVAVGLLEAANRTGAHAQEWHDIDYFKRRDLIVRNSKEIADIVNNSVIDASALVPASDEDVLVKSIERYASMVFGSAGQ